MIQVIPQRAFERVSDYNARVELINPIVTPLLLPPIKEQMRLVYQGRRYCVDKGFF